MKFIVSVREVHVQMILIEAASETEAIECVRKDEGVALDNTLEFSHRLPPSTWTVDPAAKDLPKLGADPDVDPSI